jgi:dTDP-D-glucose 4,6-dehydratase
LGEAGVIAIFIDNLLLNKNIKIFGSGNQERDFIYVDDYQIGWIPKKRRRVLGTIIKPTSRR